MATGGSAATGASQTSSSPPVVAGLKWGKEINGWYYATDPNNTNYQIGYSPNAKQYNGGTGPAWDYSNPKTGQYDSGLKQWPTTLNAAVQDFEQINGNVPLATIKGILGGWGFGKAPTPATGTTVAKTTPKATPTTTATTTDPIDTLIADLPSLIGDNNADPASQSTQQPEVLPTTSGGGDSAASPVVPLLLIGVALALGFWWYKTHHKKAHAAA